MHVKHILQYSSLVQNIKFEILLIYLINLCHYANITAFFHLFLPNYILLFTISKKMYNDRIFKLDRETISAPRVTAKSLGVA